MSTYILQLKIKNVLKMSVQKWCSHLVLTKNNSLPRAMAQPHTLISTFYGLK